MTANRAWHTASAWGARSCWGPGKFFKFSVNFGGVGVSNQHGSLKTWNHLETKFDHILS